MTCPDWKQLVRSREAGRDPDGWRQAMRHLASCDDCRRRSAAEDPLLAFRRIGVVETEPGEVTDRDIREVSREVRAVVRSRNSESGRGRRVWPRIAAAAVFLVAIVTLRPDAPRQTTFSTIADEVEVVDRTGPPEGTSIDPVPGSLVEGLDRPGARVYEMRQKGVSIVMIVDDSLDV